MKKQYRPSSLLTRGCDLPTPTITQAIQEDIRSLHDCHILKKMKSDPRSNHIPKPEKI